MTLFFITTNNVEEPIGQNNMTPNLFGGFNEIDPSGRIVRIIAGEPIHIETILTQPVALPMDPLTEEAIAAYITLPNPEPHPLLTELGNLNAEEWQNAINNAFELSNLPFWEYADMLWNT